MIRRERSTCAMFQAALIDFANRPARTVGTAAALAHLERCRSCEDELAGIMRTIAGLRSLAHGLDGVEPAPESWPILRARVARPNPVAWRWRLSLGGLMMSTAAVALFILGNPGRGPIPAVRGSDQSTQVTTIDRHYDPPAGLLTAGIINAIAGVDVSAIARRRSSELHLGPGNVDRNERDRVSTPIHRPEPAVPPFAVAQS